MSTRLKRVFYTRDARVASRETRVALRNTRVEFYACGYASSRFAHASLVFDILRDDLFQLIAVNLVLFS